MNFKLDLQTIEQLKTYSALLNKDIDTILKEALEEYFVKAEEKLLKDSIEKDSAMTNLSYDEFWDGVDLWSE